MNKDDFITCYQQHRKGWIHSKNNESLNSVTSSIWSCHNLSPNTSETSGDESARKIQDVKEEQECDKENKLLDQSNKSFLITSASTLSTSNSESIEKLSSSYDDGSSSEFSGTESIFETQPLKLPSKIITVKSSEDDEPEVTNRRLERVKKKLSPRACINRCAQHTSVALASSPPYPSSLTSSIEFSISSTSSFSEEETIKGVECWNEMAPSSTTKQFNNAIKKENEEPKIILLNNDDDDDGFVDKYKKPSQNFKEDIQETKQSISSKRERNVRINVSGKHFHVSIDALNKYPNTLLGNPRKRHRFYDYKQKEYFLDRHRDTFQVILDFYNNGGVLMRPDDIPIDVFINELKFYMLDRSILEEFLREEGILHVEVKQEMPSGKMRKYIWQLFEEHDGSCCAKLITFISAAVITISVIVFCLETLKGFESYNGDSKNNLRLAINSCKSYFENFTNESATNKNLPSMDGHLISNMSKNQTNLSSKLKNILSACHESVSIPKFKFTFLKCSLELQGRTDRINLVLSKVANCNRTAQILIKTPPSALQNHQIRHETFVNDENKKLKAVLNEENISDKPDKMYKNKKVDWSYTFTVLNQTCLDLTNMSSKTRYEWLIVEGFAGGPAGILFLLETVCISWFLTELVLRFYSSPNKIKFMKSFLNLIDFLAILPYFITLIVTTLETKTQARPQTATILRTIRLVRMLRILKLSRYSRGFRILGLTLLRSTRVLVLLVCFQMVLAILFSSIAYFVECDNPKTMFKSIPETFWWALITMTTVGYGDVYPITVWGKITGACCAIMGILCISFPVPVVVSNFNYLYHLDKDKFKLTPEDLMEEEEEEEVETLGKFPDNLFQEMQKSASSLADDAKPPRNPAQLWNIARKNYRKMSLASIDAKLEKVPSRSSVTFSSYGRTQSLSGQEKPRQIRGGSF